jgi:hypothetical protein
MATTAAPLIGSPKTSSLPSRINAPEVATPAVVLALVAAVVIPVHVPLLSEIFNPLLFAG